MEQGPVGLLPDVLDELGEVLALVVAVLDTPQQVVPAPGAFPDDFFSPVRIDARPQGGAVLPLQRLVDHAPFLLSSSFLRSRTTSCRTRKFDTAAIILSSRSLPRWKVILLPLSPGS